MALIEQANPWDNHAEAFAAWTVERYGATPETTSPVIAAMLEAGADVTGQEVLDAACGEGLLSRVLFRLGAHVTAIDASPRLIAIARRRSPEGGVEFRVDDLTRPISDLVGRFDLVASHLALNDVADYHGFAATLASALRPGGRMVLALNNPYSSVVRGHLKDYFDRDQRPVYGGLSDRLGGTFWYYHRTLEQYVAAFLRTGVRLTRLMDVPHGGPFPFFMVLAFDKP